MQIFSASPRAPARRELVDDLRDLLLLALEAALGVWARGTARAQDERKHDGSGEADPHTD